MEPAPAPRAGARNGPSAAGKPARCGRRGSGAVRGFGSLFPVSTLLRSLRWRRWPVAVLSAVPERLEALVQSQRQALRNGAAAGARIRLLPADPARVPANLRQ